LYFVSGDVPKPDTHEVAPTTPSHDESGQHTRPSTTRLAGQQPDVWPVHCVPHEPDHSVDGSVQPSVPVFHATVPLAEQ
jgi:hypothetical protein